MELKGIGPTTACALVASIGNAHDSKNGRQLAAWLGKRKLTAVCSHQTRIGNLDAHLI